MIQFKLKSAEEVYEYIYPVCEVKDCTTESEKLTSTETRFVDFCKKHYEDYIMGEIWKKS